MQPILASLLSEVPVSEPPAAHACSFEQVGRRSKVSAPDVRPMTTQQHSVRRQNTDGDLTMRVSQDMANGWGRQSTAISMLPRDPKKRANPYADGSGHLHVSQGGLPCRCNLMQERNQITPHILARMAFSRTAAYMYAGPSNIRCGAERTPHITVRLTRMSAP